MEGIPNHKTHVWMKARATVTAVESAMGTASGHLVKQSMQVRRYTHPLVVKVPRDRYAHGQSGHQE